MNTGASDLPLPGPFRLPPANVARHPAALLAVRDLRGWIDGLPLANPPRCAQMLLQQLRLLVRDPEPGGRFAALLALYQGPLDALLEIVRERLHGFGDSAGPLDQLEYQAVELLQELAHGHLRLANQATAAGKAPGHADLCSAMRLLDHALNIERMHYHRLDPDAWRRVVGIYLHAEHLGLADRDCPGTPVAGEPRTLRGLFFRSLLVSLSDPHHHRPNEVLGWLSWLGDHAGGLRLSLLPEGAYAIPVDVSATLPPLAGARRGRPGPDTRYLAVDTVLERLQTATDAPSGLRQALLDVIKGRKTPEQRQSERQPRNQPYRLVYGLRAIHERLAELIQGRPPGPTRQPPLDCTLVNLSRTGAALQLHGPASPPLCVDEPVLAEGAMTGSGGAPVGFAARIRRQVSGDGQQIEIGVEKLTGRLLPVRLRSATAETGRNEPEALLLQDIESGRLTLIAARSRYRDDECVTVEGPNTRYTLRLRSVILAVQHVAYIQVEVVEH